MRQRSRATKMAGLVARWRASEETQAGFARRHGIPPWTFWYWCRKLTPGRTTVPPDVFVPVHVAPDVAAPVVEIVFATGDRLHLRPGAPADLVQAAVTALRSRC
jgi:hypothetical protein